MTEVTICWASWSRPVCKVCIGPVLALSVPCKEPEDRPSATGGEPAEITPPANDREFGTEALVTRATGLPLVSVVET